MSFSSAYKNKKIFLTGHTGFKGTWMTIWLAMLGARVKGYALKPDKISLHNQVKTHLQCKSVLADIRDRKKLRKELISFQPDFIFHFAAQPLVLESYKTPVETFEVNGMGTANLLEALRDLKKECVVVIVTTDKVYENPETGNPFTEHAPLGGHDPYSASKAAAEIVVQSFRLSFFHPNKYAEHKKSIATARAGNVIGGGDYAANRLLPDIFRSLSGKKSVNIRNPHSIRPWQHVLDPLSGYLQLAAMMKKNPRKLSTSFNFGPALSDTLTVEDVARMAVNSWGSGKYKIQRKIHVPHEAGMLRLNISKAKKELGWKPKWDAKHAVDQTIQWYKDSLINKDVYGICMKDIEMYNVKSF